MSASIGLALTAARKKAGLTQAELATRMGTTQSAISRAESGGITPSAGFLERLVNATGETLEMGMVTITPRSTPRTQATVGNRERKARIRRAVGTSTFNPWDRDPTPAEQRSLLADGLTREHFQG